MNTYLETLPDIERETDNAITAAEAEAAEAAAKAEAEAAEAERVLREQELLEIQAGVDYVLAMLTDTLRRHAIKENLDLTNEDAMKKLLDAKFFGDEMQLNGCGVPIRNFVRDFRIGCADKILYEVESRLRNKKYAEELALLIAVDVEAARENEEADAEEMEIINSNRVLPSPEAPPLGLSPAV